MKNETTQDYDHAYGLVITRLQGTRKGGEELAYIHSVRVSESLRTNGYPSEVVIAGLLHDIIEDSDITLKELAEAGYSERIVSLVDLCTHNAETQNKDERWTKMIARLINANDKDAWAIKLADLLDNCLSCHALPENRQQFLRTVKAPLMLSITKDIFGMSGLWQELAEEINKKSYGKH